MAAVTRILAALAVALLVCLPARAEEINLPTEAELAQVSELMEGAGAQIDLAGVIRLLVTGGQLNYQELLGSAKAALIAELTRSLALLTQLLVPAVLMAVLGELLGGSDRKLAAAGFICFLSAAIALMDTFRGSLSAAMALSSDVGRFNDAMFPVLTALLAASGANLTAAAFAPLLTLGAGLLSGAVGTWGGALCALASVVAVFGSLSERFSLGKLLSLAKSLLNWMMGLLLTGFLGLVTAQNLLIGAQDSAALRASKYAAKNLIPGVGGEVADAMYAVSGSALLVKNAAGITGLIALGLLCMGPLIRLFATLLTAKAAGALLEPLGGGPLSKLIERFADVFSMLLVVGCAAVVVAVILIGAALSAGGAMLSA